MLDIMIFSLSNFVLKGLFSKAVKSLRIMRWRVKENKREGYIYRAEAKRFFHLYLYGENITDFVIELKSLQNTSLLEP